MVAGVIGLNALCTLSVCPSFEFMRARFRSPGAANLDPGLGGLIVATSTDSWPGPRQYCRVHSRPIEPDLVTNPYRWNPAAADPVVKGAELDPESSGNLWFIEEPTDDWIKV